MGKYLSSRLKRNNHRHLSTMATTEYRQARFHIHQVLALGDGNYLPALKQIETPVHFLNGALDEYTPAAEAKVFQQYVGRSSFAVAEHTGHLLDLSPARPRWRYTGRCWISWWVSTPRCRI